MAARRGATPDPTGDLFERAAPRALSVGELTRRLQAAVEPRFRAVAPGTIYSGRAGYGWTGEGIREVVPLPLTPYHEVRAVAPNFDRAAALLSPKVEGDRLTVTIKDDAISTLWSVGRPVFDAATKGPREAARRTQSVNNLKQIALAMHNYHDANGRFPPGWTSQHSHVPFLLPFLEQGAVTATYRFDLPWNHLLNQPAIRACTLITYFALIRRLASAIRSVPQEWPGSVMIASYPSFRSTSARDS